jgi:hypothetical protein
VFMLASPRLPVSRNSTTISAYAMTVRRTFSVSGIFSAKWHAHGGSPQLVERTGGPSSGPGASAG